MDQPRNHLHYVVHPEPSAHRSNDAAAESTTVTRAELLDAVYNVCPMLSRAQAREIFEMTLEEIVGALLRDDPVKLRSFGNFSTRRKRERVGRNPRSGVTAKISARRVLAFKASATLIARLNGGSGDRE